MLTITNRLTDKITSPIRVIAKGHQLYKVTDPAFNTANPPPGNGPMITYYPLYHYLMNVQRTHLIRNDNSPNDKPATTAPSHRK